MTKDEDKKEWCAFLHTYVCYTLSGKEWERMIAWFADNVNSSGWEDIMIAETRQTRDEVRQIGIKVKRLFELIDTDAKNMLADGQRHELNIFNGQDDVRNGVRVQMEMQGIRADYEPLRKQQKIDLIVQDKKEPDFVSVVPARSQAIADYFLALNSFGG